MVIVELSVSGMNPQKVPVLPRGVSGVLLRGVSGVLLRGVCDSAYLRFVTVCVRAPVCCTGLRKFFLEMSPVCYQLYPVFHEFLYSLNGTCC
jgi:hypothetical protein